MCIQRDRDRCLNIELLIRDHACHHRTCDPTQNTCDLSFLPDEGGLTAWGCRECTPGEGGPHVLGCELIGWNVPARRDVLA